MDLLLMSLCTTNECIFDGNYGGKCVLHCDKDGSNIDSNEDISIEREDILIDFCKYLSNLISLKVEDNHLHLKNINFPIRHKDFDYADLFTNIPNVSFYKCIFNSESLSYEDINFQYDKCIFNNTWYITNVRSLKGYEAIYDYCDFKENVNCYGDYIKEVESSLFFNCKFKNNISLKRTIFKASIFKKSNYDFTPPNELNLSIFEIEDCVLDDKFYFNNKNVNFFVLKNVEFNHKVELKHNHFKHAKITNVKFKNLFDAYSSSFDNFNINRSIFENFAGFEKCKFGLKEALEQSNAEFEYVTFESITSFRKASFYNGLNLENTNSKESLNFLNAKIEPQNTNRETYRIIKNSFDKIGNQIEANKYFLYEMRKYKEELKLSKTFSTERVIFWFNENVSNFGSNIIKPLLLMLTCAVIYYSLVLGYEANYLYKIYEPANSTISTFMTHANSFAKVIPPYGRFLKEGMEFVTLFFHIFFLIFTWHFIVAIKRCTKR
jgi:hypothetical protein